MQMLPCSNCGRLSGFKRALGVGTFLMVLLTFGLWLLVIPFYPVRCSVCGLRRSVAFFAAVGTGQGRRFLFTGVGALGVLFVFTALIHAVRESARQPDNPSPAAPISDGRSRSVQPTALRSKPSARVAEASDTGPYTAPAIDHYVNPRFGFHFNYPASFEHLADASADNVETLRSLNGEASIVAIGSDGPDHTVAEAYAMELSHIHSDITYQAKGQTWLVLSFRDRGRAIYLKRFVGEGSQNSFIISFPQDKEAEYDYIPALVEHSFHPGDLSQSH